MATNFRVKITKLAYSPTFVALAFQNRMEYHKSDFYRLNSDALATSCKNLVNFSPVIPEFKRLKGIHPSLISSSATLTWQCHWQTLWWSVLSFL